MYIICFVTWALALTQALPQHGAKGQNDIQNREATWQS